MRADCVEKHRQVTSSVTDIRANDGVPARDHQVRMEFAYDGGTWSQPSPHDGATRYRIVDAPRPSADSEPVVPTLEDGYVLLAQQHSLTPAESAA